MEDVKCLFCKTKTDNIIWQENGYSGRKCVTCGLIYISPRPTEDEMRFYYDQGKSGEITARELSKPQYVKELNAKYTMSIIQRYKNQGDLLELAPGGGQFLQVAKANHFAPYTVEINKQQADYLSEHLHIETENYSATQPEYFLNRQFDVIYNKDLLSHLYKPLEVFQYLYNRLKKDGILIFETGNSGDLSKRWLHFLNRLSYPEHVYLFSESNIQTLLKSTGFDCIERIYHSTVLSVLYLKLIYGVKSTLNFLKPAITKSVQTSEKTGNVFYQKTSFTAMGKIKDLLSHLLAYRWSRYFPRSWPSTIIYIAKKI